VLPSTVFSDRGAKLRDQLILHQTLLGSSFVEELCPEEINLGRLGLLLRIGKGRSGLLDLGDLVLRQGPGPTLPASRGILSGGLLKLGLETGYSKVTFLDHCQGLL